MLYYTFTVKDNDYKCRLGAKECVDLEKKLGTNPLNIFMKIAQTQELPSLEVMITMLHASLQKYNHVTTMETAYDIYDEYVDEGHNLMDLVNVIMEVMKVSGLIPEEVKEDDNAKNAVKVIQK